MKYIVFYEVSPEAMTSVMTHFSAHRARLDDFHARGLVIGAGPLGNPPEGAMGIFSTREAAEEFVRGDPFVTNGVVAKWKIIEWDAVFL